MEADAACVPLEQTLYLARNDVASEPIQFACDSLDSPRRRGAANRCSRTRSLGLSPYSMKS